MENLIRVSNVEKYYGSRGRTTKALDGVSFDIAAGEFTGIMGASGSGKTTLLNVLATIDTVTAGHIYYGDQDITTLKKKDLADFRKHNLGFVFQDYNLLDTLTVRENIMLAMTLAHKDGKAVEARVGEIMEQLSISDIGDKFPYEVSGGQLQRAAAARALVNRPRLILADEPTGALDSKSSTMLLETFGAMNEKLGATILMVTHDPMSASYCKRILFLRDGAIFHELRRGENRPQREFLNQILDVLSLTGGGASHAQ